MIESTAHQLETPDSETCLALLERVVSSVQLHRAPRLREFLSYVGKRALKDGCLQVHEQEIGVEVFGRPQGYDTSVDNIVRANATELRKRLDVFFESEGQHETLIMEIPRGSYIPVFKYRIVKPSVELELRTVADALVAGQSNQISIPDSSSTARQPRWMVPALIAASVVIVALSVECAFLWIHNRDEHRALYAWQYSPAVATFWSDFLGEHRDTDIVMSDAFIKLAEDRAGKSFSLDDYVSGKYITQLLSQEKDPAVRSVLQPVSAWRSSNESHLILARRILALDPLGKSIHLYYSRDYTPDLLKQDNSIFLGSRVTNPWESLFDARLNFTIIRDGEGFSEIVNRAPAAGEQAVYPRADPAGYCVVAYLPNPAASGKVLLIEGTSVQATEACGEFLLSEEQVFAFQKMLHVTRFPYFEVLLKTSQVKDTSFTGKIQAYRTYPSQH